MDKAKEIVNDVSFNNLKVENTDSASNKQEAVEDAISNVEFPEGVTSSVNSDGSKITLSKEDADDVVVTTDASFELTKAAKAVKEAQEVINNLPKPNAVNLINVDDFQEDVYNAKKLVAEAQELDDNANIDTSALDELEKRVTNYIAQNAISEIGNPDEFSQETLKEDKARVQNATDKIEDAEKAGVALKSNTDYDGDGENIANYDHYEVAQEKIENLKDK